MLPRREKNRVRERVSERGREWHETQKLCSDSFVPTFPLDFLSLHALCDIWILLSPGRPCAPLSSVSFSFLSISFLHRWKKNRGRERERKESTRLNWVEYCYSRRRTLFFLLPSLVPLSLSLALRLSFIKHPIQKVLLFFFLFLHFFLCSYFSSSILPTPLPSSPNFFLSCLKRPEYSKIVKDVLQHLPSLLLLLSTWESTIPKSRPREKEIQEREREGKGGEKGRWKGKEVWKKKRDQPVSVAGFTCSAHLVLPLFLFLSFFRSSFSLSLSQAPTHTSLHSLWFSGLSSSLSFFLFFCPPFL